MERLRLKQGVSRQQQQKQPQQPQQQEQEALSFTWLLAVRANLRRTLNGTAAILLMPV